MVEKDGKCREENNEELLMAALEAVTNKLEKHEQIRKDIKIRCMVAFPQSNGFINSSLSDSMEEQKQEYEVLIEDLHQSMADGCQSGDIEAKICEFLWRHDGDKETAKLEMAFLGAKALTGESQGTSAQVQDEKNDEFLAKQVLIDLARLCKSLLKKMDFETDTKLSKLVDQTDGLSELGVSEENPMRKEAEDSITGRVILKLKKDITVYLGIELSRSLVDLRVLLSDDKQTLKLLPLEISVTSGALKKKKEIHLKIKNILERTSAVVLEMRKSKKMETVSLEEKQIKDLNERFKTAVDKLQLVVLCLQDMRGVPLESKLAKLDHRMKQYEEHTEAAKQKVEKLKEQSGQDMVEFCESCRRQMEQEIYQIWNTFW